MKLKDRKESETGVGRLKRERGRAEKQAVVRGNRRGKGCYKVTLRVTKKNRKKKTQRK